MESSKHIILENNKQIRIKRDNATAGKNEIALGVNLAEKTMYSGKTKWGDKHLCNMVIIIFWQAEEFKTEEEREQLKETWYLKIQKRNRS